MKTIGLIGGMSWESSAVYYKLINQEVKKRLGGFHSCKSVMTSVDFAEIAHFQHDGKWEELGEMMAQSAKSLENAGADFIVLCTNTMHKLAPYIEEAVEIPFLHIGDATAMAIKEKTMDKVALLGTKFTMEQAFLKDRLKEKYNIEAIIPNDEEREVIHNIIYQELVKGIITSESRVKYLNIIDGLIKKGAQGVILGCTEIGLLVTNEYTDHTLFDTTEIHAMNAVDLSLAHKN